MTDTSPRAELHDTGLTPVEIINRHSHLGSLNDPSNYSSITQTDHASTVSRSSGAAPHPASVSRPELPSPDPRPDSPPLGTYYDVSAPVSPQATGQGQQQATGGEGGRKVESDVSAFSERDRAHLRQISDATVSSVGSQGAGDRVLPQVAEGSGSGGTSTTSPLRRSIFRESREDMGGGGGS